MINMEDHWDGKERRLSGAFDVRSQLLSEINKAQDQSTRTILLLLFGVLEQNNAASNRVEKKIDSWLDDKDRLRRIVLDIHEPSHYKHHEWTARRMLSEEENTAAAKSTLRKVIETLIVQAVVAIISALGTVIVLTNNLPKQ